jgi:hypothetical protein
MKSDAQERIEKVLGSDYIVRNDYKDQQYNVETPPWLIPLQNSYITWDEFDFLIASAGGDSDDENERLKAFFFGTSKRTDENSLPSNSASWWPESHNWKSGPVADPQGCNHEYVEVTLFHFPSLRCRFCDIKKPGGV